MEEADIPLLERINQVLRKVIDIQLKNNEPPETGYVFSRLAVQGMTEAQCYEMIGRVLAEEYKYLQSDGQFDDARYRANLLSLLDIPDTQEE